MLTVEKAVSDAEKNAEQINNNASTISIPINTSVPIPLALFALSDKNNKYLSGPKVTTPPKNIMLLLYHII
jgi:hypothetical protein